MWEGIGLLEQEVELPDLRGNGVPLAGIGFWCQASALLSQGVTKKKLANYTQESENMLKRSKELLGRPCTPEGVAVCSCIVSGEVSKERQHFALSNANVVSLNRRDSRPLL